MNNLKRVLRVVLLFSILPVIFLLVSADSNSELFISYFDSNLLNGFISGILFNLFTIVAILFLALVSWLFNE